MKRIIAALLCTSVTLSTVSLYAGAGTEKYWGDFENTIISENVMKISTDKNSYFAGDTVKISAQMTSVWGNPVLEDQIEGYPDYILPGAYGMDVLSATLIFDKTVFTAKPHKNLLKTSTLKNHDSPDAAVYGNTPDEANKNGAYSLTAKAGLSSADNTKWGFFNGSGRLWEWNLTIAADAEAGTYYLPVGPYRLTDSNGDSVSKPVIRFSGSGLDDRYWAWNGNADSLLTDREVTYSTGYVGASRIVTNDAVTSSYGTAYECSYVKIVIEETESATPPKTEFTLSTDKTSYNVGETVTVTFKIKNNNGLTNALNSSVSFDNTALKLTGVSSPLAGAGNATVNLDAANTLGSFDSRGTPATANILFASGTGYASDGTLLTLKFKVLSTAENGESAVTLKNTETGLSASADVKIKAGGHSHSFNDTVDQPNCAVAGTAYKTCSCGLSYKISDISAKSHVTSKSSRTVTTPATCTTDGSIVTYCDKCGKIAITETIDAIGHDLRTVTTTTLSCSQDEMGYKVCLRDGCGYESDITVIRAKRDHKRDGVSMWSDPYVSKRPTTSDTGIRSMICELCGKTWDYEVIPKLDILYGDCNMDGKVQLTDVRVLLQYMVRKGDEEAQNELFFSKENADVLIERDPDTGEQIYWITLQDASLILKYLAKWDVTLGVDRVKK